MKIIRDVDTTIIDFTGEISFTKNKTGVKIGENIENTQIKNYTIIGVENRKIAVKNILLFLNVNKYIIYIILLFIKKN